MTVVKSLHRSLSACCSLVVCSAFAAVALAPAAGEQPREAGVAAPAKAQESSEAAPSVQGTLIDEAGQPIVGVVVGVERESRRQMIVSTPTDERGRFTFRSLASVDERTKFAVGLHLPVRAHLHQRKPLIVQAPWHEYRIRGVWRADSWQGDHHFAEKVAGQAERKGLSLFISNERLSVWNGSKVTTRYAYRIYPSKSPRALNLTDERGQTLRGGYRFDGELLTVTLRPDAREREAGDGPSITVVLRPERIDEEVKKLRKSPDAGVRKIGDALTSDSGADLLDGRLVEVVSFLHDLHEVDFVIDEEALKKAGLSPQTPVDDGVCRVTLHETLTILLAPLGGTYKVEGGKIIITSRR